MPSATANNASARSTTNESSFPSRTRPTSVAYPARSFIRPSPRARCRQRAPCRRVGAAPAPTRVPFTNVPFVLPRSSIQRLPPELYAAARARGRIRVAGDRDRAASAAPDGQLAVDRERGATSVRGLGDDQAPAGLRVTPRSRLAAPWLASRWPHSPACRRGRGRTAQPGRASQLGRDEQHHPQQEEVHQCE